jgi:hypothetical protein
MAERMKTLAEIDEIMLTIPRDWRYRWCGGENGPCACTGCVQIGNRIIMYEIAMGKKFLGDPEYINESKIPPEIYKKYKITKNDWEWWVEQNQIRKFAF